MKNLFLLALVLVALSMTSCGIMNNGLVQNTNVHSTEVVLAEKNFKVISLVKGESSAFYFLGIGGFSKEGLIAEARGEMMNRADMIGKPRAIVNETIEIRNSFFVLAWTKKVVVTAQVVEFTSTKQETK